MRVAVAQISPVFLDRRRTLAKLIDATKRAADDSCGLVVFGETVLPGYPIWLSRAGGATFDDDYNKQVHSLYLDQAVDIEAGDLDDLRKAAAEHSIAIIVGVAERAADRGRYTIYCSRVAIGVDGAVLSVHRKLMPTYEERLAWGVGDGAGLVVHPIGEFTVGALNCWENWMPLARASLYAQGEDLHVMLWPGNDVNTRDLTRVVARESRSFVISVSGFLRDEDIPADFPGRDRITSAGEVFHNGGSAVAGPDGEWITTPQVGVEGLFTVDLDIARVREERQNFDASGHYSRPDVLKLTVDRRRQQSAEFLDDESGCRTDGVETSDRTSTCR